MTDKTTGADKKNGGAKAIAWLETMFGRKKMVLARKPHIKEYKKIRKLHAEILGSMMEYYYSGKFDCGGIYNEFDLNSDVGTQAFVDAVVYKNTKNTNSITKEFLKGNRYKKPEKIELLQSMAESQIGLFRVTDVEPAEGYVFIEEVFNGIKYKIIDFGGITGLGYNDFHIYTRIISFRGVNFSTWQDFICLIDDPFVKKFIKNEKKNYSPEKEYERFIKLYNHFYEFEKEEELSETEEEELPETENRKIFSKYNPVTAVKHCPKGRAHVRKLLDVYAKAAVNLYGVISVEDFVEIFHSQNEEQTNADEVFSLLLPLVLKDEDYCFYKSFIVHYLAIENFEYADSWLEIQGDKPRFIPEKDEFLNFKDEHYYDDTQDLYWGELLVFIGKEWPDNQQRFRFYYWLKQFSTFNPGAAELSELLEKYGIVFESEKQAQSFFDLYINAQNNSRMWVNKGHTPVELAKITENQTAKRGSSEIVHQNRKKIGQNERCPCGSGKKYKKCCKMTEDAKTAQLSRSECDL